MQPTNRHTLLTGAICLAATVAGGASAADRVQTANGMVEGTTVQSTGIRVFRGST
jgi:hypothetical protein